MERGWLKTSNKKDFLDNYFEEFIKKKPLFKDKNVFQSSYTPDEILHREQQVDCIAKILAPCLRLNKPSNLFIYGKTGTGKTVTTLYVTNKILETAKKNNISSLYLLYINCKLKKIADTEYRIIAQLARELGKEIPITGLPTEEVYKIFFDTLEEKKGLLIIILDEIDQLIKKTGDEILYNLTRANSELKKSQISIIGISNNLTFTENLDPRVKSSLSEEEVVFPPYNALQIQDILRRRAEIGFNKGVIEEGVIEKCAAYAAREHGDARRAIDLLRVSAELAEREGSQKVEIRHIDLAEEKIEREKVLDIIVSQPKQFQATLYSIVLVSKKTNGNIYTGDIYTPYKKICTNIGIRPLTQRRVSDIIAEFDMLGIVNARVLSKGRYGRTREITLAIPENLQDRVEQILEKELELKGI
ncbi:MAG: ORC1-type DNA replication protein [Candidatus Woesearchaeota archaeon]|nr:ORC1-type DNA replication protein [Candidatus Woesearchaeota archaeon]